MADEKGARLINNSAYLASALKKLNEAAKVNPLRFGSQASAHMFIVNPFTAKSLMHLFSTHPDVNKRIERLNNLVL